MFLVGQRPLQQLIYLFFFLGFGPLRLCVKSFTQETTPTAPTTINQNQPTIRVIRVNSWLFPQKRALKFKDIKTKLTFLLISLIPLIPLISLKQAPQTIALQ
jgi:hypothetical protein